MNKRVLINASNLHSGGGVQVATSFIYELSKFDKNNNLNIFVSSAVDKNLKGLNVDSNFFKSYVIGDSEGILSIFSRNSRFISSFDIVFTIFGPNYNFFKAPVEVVGFAQPWIIYPNNEVYKSYCVIDKLKTRLKFLIQKLFFLRADKIIVELDHVMEGLKSTLGSSCPSISIVHNCISSLYSDSTLWKSITYKKRKDKITIGYMARDYAHKNIDILPEVKSILKHTYSIDADFLVTLSDIEWSRKDVSFKNAINNVGMLSVDQCPNFYSQIDLVLFPSLLECFSATPLEAMVMKKPLVASDRQFVRDVCQQYALYFDPVDPEDIARKIVNRLNSDIDLDDAKEHAIKFSSARSRAKKYIEILTSV